MKTLDKFVTDGDCAELVECLRACKYSARKTGYSTFETDAPVDCIHSAELTIRERRLAK